MKKRVLVINPWIYDFAAYDYWLKPLGLLYLAAFLRENGLEVTFLDCLDPAFWGDTFSRPKRRPGGHGHFIKETVSPPPFLSLAERPYHRYGVTPEKIRQKLSTFPAFDLILAGTTMTYWYPGLWEIVRISHDLSPATPVAIGGIYVTLCPDHARKSGADYVLAGPGERQVSFLVEDILGLPLLYEPDLHSPDTLPYPAYDLLLEPDELPILTSRGCPFRCPYCASHLLSPSFVRRAPEKVVDEIEWWLQSKGVRNFAIYDDAFLMRAEDFAVPFLREIIRRRLDIWLHCPNGLHIREITSLTARLMYRAQVTTLCLGLETNDRKNQVNWGGKVFNEEFEAAVCYLKEAGYEGRNIGVYILCGLPEQEPEEVAATIEYVKAWGARPILAEYSPIPGTDLWSKAKEVSPFPLQEEPLFQNNTLLPCWRDGERDGRVSYRYLKSLSKKNVEIISKI